MAITYPTTGSSSYQSGSSTTLSFAVTLDASVTKFIVAVGGRQTQSSVTYNGVAMTQVTAASINYGYEYNAVWYLDNPPTGSSYNVVVTYSTASTDRFASYVGAAGPLDAGVGTKPTPATGVSDGSTITTNITTTKDYSDIIQCTFCNNDTLSINLGGGQSSIVPISSGVLYSIDKKSTVSAGATSVTAAPSSSSPNMDTIVFEIKQTVALTSGVIAAYNFDSGANLTDTGPSGYTLTNNNSVTFPSGKINEAADYGSTNTNKSLTSTSNLLPSGSGGLTISFWYKLATDIGASSYGLLNFANANSGNYRDFYINYNYNGGTRQLTMNLHRMGVDDQGFSANSTLGTTYKHIVLTWDGTTIRGYVDNSSIGSGSASGNGSSSDGFTGLTLGYNPRNSVYTPGQIDAVIIWNRPLSTTDIATLYNSGSGTQYPFGTAYSLALAMGSFTLTGFAVTIQQALNLALANGSFALTGYDISFALGKGLFLETGNFVVTGFDLAITKAMSIVLGYGEYALTGYDIAVGRAYTLIAEMGSFVVTGFAVRLPIFWRNVVKNVVTVRNLIKSNI